MRIEDLETYEIMERRPIADINSESYVLRHKKTGARVALLSNDDDNKVFYIGFRTPPKDSTGVAHILEHSVLCGSEKYPVKDPFVELVKGSLNTFLNAMTYPDKTVYPVASCNEKDFENLMSVYLDAVFHPNIYKNESIFRQEGWHYERGKETGELTINGVVYNEMKGAFSSPEDVLQREMMRSLYPDTEYGVESGGDPKDIPKLTYEQFLDFHRAYYHPSNSYIYLYGDMDMAKELEYIDREYLSRYDRLAIDSEIHEQKTPDKPARIVKEIPLAEGEDAKGNTFLSENFSVGNSLDRELYVALQILDYCLCSAPGAVLKQALVDAGLGNDVYSSYENGIRQPYFSIISKDVDAEKESEFIDTIGKVLRGIADKGFDKKALMAAVNYFEFKYREADFGAYPKGLMYGLQLLDSWLYDDTLPFIHVEANDTYARLKKRVDEGWFEELVERYLIDNPHKSTVVVIPKAGVMEREDKEFKDSMHRLSNSLSEAELSEIEDKFAALREFQESEDAPEDLKKLPMLERKDLKKEANRIILDERKLGDNTLLYHKVFTNGIGYLRLIFDLKDIPGEYYPYVGILKNCMGMLDTEHYTYGDLFNEINLITGGITYSDVVYKHTKDKNFKATLEVKARVLYPNMERAVALIEEVLFSSNYADEKRLLEILLEARSRMQAQLMSSGHLVALSRAISYATSAGVVSEELSGMPMYRLICELAEDFDNRKAELIQKLSMLAKMIFRKENLTIDYTAEEKGCEAIEAPLDKLIGRLYTDDVERENYIPVPERKNEGLSSAGQVQYVCRAGDFRKAGLSYRGELKVLKVLMGYTYLWMNVRVKGGAYGCMCQFSRSGESLFVSYRDPNLSETVSIFEGAADFVKSFSADERTMTQYVIGAISDMDTPLTPQAKGAFALAAYMTGVEDEDLQRERDEVLLCTPDKIRVLSEYIDAFMQQDNFCAVGNAAKLKENSGLFYRVENLL